MGSKIKFRVKKMCLTKWDTSNRALQNLVWLFPVQQPGWSRGTVWGGLCQIRILEYPPSYWVLWDGGHLRWGCVFRLWGPAGNWRWVSCVLGDDWNHWTVGWEAWYHSSFSDAFSIPLYPQKEGWVWAGESSRSCPLSRGPHKWAETASFGLLY